ncbi:MAG TPA: tetratricopeptide repeat protein [Rhodospirillales bacterium]
MQPRAAIIGLVLLTLLWQAAFAGSGGPDVAPADRAALCALLAENGGIVVCQEAARTNPGNVAVQRDLAKSFIAIGDFDSAVEVYQTIAAAHPDDAQAQADLGGALGFVRRYVEAVEPMETVMRLNPDDITAYRSSAVVYLQLGRAADAVRVTRKAAGLGDAIAMFDLFGFYRDGVGVAADERQAVAWAERAADNGHLGALDLMVRVHLEGLMGVAVNEDKAKAWAWKFRNTRLGRGAAPQR